MSLSHQDSRTCSMLLASECSTNSYFVVAEIRSDLCVVILVIPTVISSIEQHVELIADIIKDLDARGLKTIEATEEAQDKWVGEVNFIASHTVFPSCNSWYLGANIRESCKRETWILCGGIAILTISLPFHRSRHTPSLYALSGIHRVRRPL